MVETTDEQPDADCIVGQSGGKMRPSKKQIPQPESELVSPVGMPKRRSVQLRRFGILVLSLNLTAIGIGMAVYWLTKYSLFSEGGILTLVSAVQLGLIARLSWKVARVRGITSWLPLWREPKAVWWLVAIGFAFLAADELLKIHEGIDTLIHVVFDMQSTAVTDRIDDIVVGMYGFIGIGVLLAYRDELKSFGEAVPYLVGGFALMFIMVALDLLTNRKDILVWLFERDAALVLRAWLSLVEDSIKLLAEACFLLGFLVVLHKARGMKDVARDLPSRNYITCK